MKYSYGSLYDDELNSYIDNIKPSLIKILKKSFPYIYCNNKMYKNESSISLNDLLQEAIVYAIEAFYKFDDKSGDNLKYWAINYVECSFRNKKKEVFRDNSDHVSLDALYFENKHEDLADDVINELSMDNDSFIYESNTDDSIQNEILSVEQRLFLNQVGISLKNKTVEKYISLIIENNNSLSSVEFSSELNVSKSRLSQIRKSILNVAKGNQKR